MVSIIIPILEEDAGAALCIQASLEGAGPTDEVILVDGGLTGMASRLVRQREEWAEKVTTVRHSGRRRLWNLLRTGVGLASGKYVIITAVGEWLEPEAAEVLERIAENLEVDVVQARKIKRIRRIAVKEAFVSSVSIDEAIRGQAFLELTEISGGDRVITPSFTDKLWRRDLLSETLRLRFEGEWGTGEILNFHYFRHARSMAFTEHPICNFNWTLPHAPCSYRRLDDLRKVYELKMLAVPGQQEGFQAELQTYLSDYVDNLIVRLGWTREAVLHYLSPVLADRFWQQSGIDTDLSGIIDEIFRTHKRNSFKNRLRELMG